MNKYILQNRPLLTTLGFFISVLLSGMANAITTLTFTDNSNPSVPFPATGSVGTVPLDVDTEFRVVAANDTISGFGNKSITSVTTPITWEFADDVNLTAVTGSDMTLGTDGSGNIAAAKVCTTPGVPPGIPAGPVVSPTEPSGGIGLFLSAPFFGAPFGFVAPIVGSNAANLYGSATISVDVNAATIQVNIPVAEAQWSNAYFLLGREDDGVNGTGINFIGTLSNIVLDSPSPGNATFDFRMTANHIIQPCEDTAGFAGQTTQWEVVGTGVAPILVLDPPATVSGAPLAATLPGTVTDDGRVSTSELASIYNVPDDLDTILPDFGTDPDGNIVDGRITQTCVGGCFAYTITGAAATEMVVLPLSAPIPNNAIYRKYINGAWTIFNESSGDVIESAPGAQGDCTTGAPLTYTPGLTAGHFCVKLTIADGGLNDDGNPGVADGTIVDPGGVAVVALEQANILLPPQSLDDAPGGCSATNKSIALTERADWIVVLAFIGLLGYIGFRRSRIE